MRRTLLAVTTLTLLVAGCATATGTSTTTAAPVSSSSSSTVPPVTVPSTTVPSPDRLDDTDMTRQERTESTGFAFDLDVPITVDGVEYLVASAICDADENALRSILNQLMAATQRAVEVLASGWPTTTIAPDPEAARQTLDQLAVAATALAVHEDRLGIVEQRWTDLNDEYSQFDGASSGPIEEVTQDRWEAIGHAVADQIDTACDAG